jgi:hypothetical protein
MRITRRWRKRIRHHRRAPALCSYGDEGRLSEEAFLHDFAGDPPETTAKVLYAVQQPFHKALLAGNTTLADKAEFICQCRPRIGRLILI